MGPIRKTVLIPKSHRLRLDLTVPADVPAGEAEVTVAFSPVRPTGKRQRLSALAGRLRNSPLCSRDPVTVQRELRDEWD